MISRYNISLYSIPFLIGIIILCIYFINNIDEKDNYKNFKHIIFAIIAVISIIILSANVNYLLLNSIQPTRRTAAELLQDIPFFTPFMTTPPLTPLSSVTRTNI